MSDEPVLAKGGTFGGFQFVNYTDEDKEAKLAPQIPNAQSREAKTAAPNSTVWIPDGGGEGEWTGQASDGKDWNVFVSSDDTNWVSYPCSFPSNINTIRFIQPQSGTPTVHGTADGQSWIEGTIGTPGSQSPPPVQT